MSKASYKVKLEQAAAINSRNASDVYKLAKLLREVFEDRDFRADIGNVDDFKAAAILDEHVKNAPWSYLDLHAMLEAEPNQAAWATRGLREIYQSSRERAATPPAAPRTRRTVTTKEYDELATQLKAVEAREKYVAKRLDESRKTYEELAAENEDLKRRLAEAHGRIMELERLVKREWAAA